MRIFLQQPPAAGESARAIKSDPRFIETREHVLGKVFSQRQVSA